MKKLIVMIGLLLTVTQAQAEVGTVENIIDSLVAKTLASGETFVDVTDTFYYDIGLSNVVFNTGDTNIVIFIDVDTLGPFIDDPTVVIDYAPIINYPVGGPVGYALNDSIKHIYDWITLGDTLNVTNAEPAKISVCIPLIEDIRLRVHREAASIADTAGTLANSTTHIRIHIIGSLDANARSRRR